MADDYIKEFISKQKEKSEKERAEKEEFIRLAKIVLQQKVQIEDQAPACWSELIEYIRRKTAEINSANGGEVITMDTERPGELTLQCGTKFLTLIFNRETQVIQVDSGFSTKRKWKALHAVIEGEQVSFAEGTTHGYHPLTFDDIVRGLLTSFAA